MSAIETLLSRLDRPVRVAVVGDIVLDHYYPVSVRRISPEFPIPVLQTPDERCVVKPGGAANVVHQLLHFPSECQLYTFVNPGTLAALPVHCQKACGRSAVLDERCQVPLKKRYYDKEHEFPLCRVDVEQPDYGMRESVNGMRKQVVKQLRTALANSDTRPDVVICSDYAKGVFDKQTAEAVIQLCKDANVPTIVDPKNEWEWWKGCTVLKPNKSEAERFVGQKMSPEAMAMKLHSLIRDYHPENNTVLITMGGDGLVGFDKRGPFCHKPKSVAKAKSVIGAGDCFAAIFALAVAHGMRVEEAAEASFAAGAIYVQKEYNEPVRPTELRGDGGKVVTAEEMCYIMQAHHGRYVFTNGCFDILHGGHLSTLRYARSLGDRLVVGLNSDSSVTALKGAGRPVCSQDDRARMLAALECVDYVVVFHEDTPKSLIESLKPQVLVKGGDYQSDTVVGADIVPEVCIAPLSPGRSTTALLEKIRGDYFRPQHFDTGGGRESHSPTNTDG